MIVWNGIERISPGQPGFVATIGNFDGVHGGHQAILASALADARGRSLPSLLVTFDPHPLSVIQPERAPKLLMTRRQKLATLEAEGLDAVLILTFTPALAALDGEEFFARELLGAVPLRAVHVGENFRFGRGRGGDLELLRKIGAERGFEVTGVAPVRAAGEVVSSSAIRRHVEQGEVEQARALLGRPFALEGEVVRGVGRGRTLSFPTANLEVENEIIPRAGVYVTETLARALRLPSVTNVGTRPTFDDGTGLQVETHVIDFDEDLYDERIEVRFLARIRDEKRFAGALDLADQIARDRAAAVAFFHNMEPLSR